MKDILNRLIKGEVLSPNEAKDALLFIGNGKANNSEIAAFLTCYMRNGITSDELQGFRNALLQLSNSVDFSDLDTIDMCGTGGDGKDTFNVSTASSFVVAASGVKVAKHGNYGVSSSCGSSNVMEFLGYSFSNEEVQLRKEIEGAGITFFHAPLFHPAMRFVGPVRKELGMKTFFNMLGPLVNPSKPNRQLTGVYSPEILPLYKDVLSVSTEAFAVVHAKDVYDEISLTCDFTVVSKNGSKEYTPEELGFERIDPSSISGGSSIEESAKILRSVLEGKGTKEQSAVVIANSGLAISVAKSISFEDGIKEARALVESGKGAEVLNKLLELN